MEDGKVKEEVVNADREHDELEDDKDDNPFNPFKKPNPALALQQQQQQMRMLQMNQMNQMNQQQQSQPQEPSAYDNEFNKNSNIVNHSFYLSGSENANRKFKIMSDLNNKYQNAQVLPDYNKGSLYKIFT
jgi:hypothetical protein